MEVSAVRAGSESSRPSITELKNRKDQPRRLRIACHLNAPRFDRVRQEALVNRHEHVSDVGYDEHLRLVESRLREALIR